MNGSGLRQRLARENQKGEAPLPATTASTRSRKYAAAGRVKNLHQAFHPTSDGCWDEGFAATSHTGEGCHASAIPRRIASETRRTEERANTLCGRILPVMLPARHRAFLPRSTTEHPSSGTRRSASIGKCVPKSRSRARSSTASPEQGDRSRQPAANQRIGFDDAVGARLHINC